MFLAFFFFSPGYEACGILVLLPQPGIEPAPPAVKALSLKHYQESPWSYFLVWSYMFSDPAPNLNFTIFNTYSWNDNVSGSDLEFCLLFFSYKVLASTLDYFDPK